MKRILSVFATIVCGLTFAANPVVANDGMISSAAVTHAGLTVDWFTQAQVGFDSEVIDVMMTVNDNKSTTTFTLDYQGGHESISQFDLDAFGKPYGIDGAETQANERKAIVELELKASGRKPDIKLSRYTLPETTIYVLTSKGVCQAIDGDTGRIKWTSRAGTRKLPSFGLGADTKHVAIINGTNIYCLEAATGKVLFNARCNGATSASPAVTEKNIFVPMVDGRVQVFEFETKGRGSLSYVSSGRVTARPLVTERTVSWPTEIGHYNVAPRGEVKTMSYRLKADGGMQSNATHKAGLIFVSSLDGYAYCLKESSGTVQWEFQAGNRVSETPIPIGNFVYVLTEGNELYKINARTGFRDESWKSAVQNITKYVGASKTKIYALDAMQKLVMIDIETGRLVGSVPAGSVNLVLENSQTDRLYVGNKSGLIQCLREVGSPIPAFHSGDFVAEAKSKAKGGPVEDTGTGDAGEEDPFAGFGGDDADEEMEEDPFGGAGDDAGEEDPFGGDSSDDEDPFGGSDDSDDEDPFGGGGDESEDEDPFGGEDEGDEDPFGGG